MAKAAQEVKRQVKKSLAQRAEVKTVAKPKSSKKITRVRTAKLRQTRRG